MSTRNTAFGNFGLTIGTVNWTALELGLAVTQRVDDVIFRPPGKLVGEYPLGGDTPALTSYQPYKLVVEGGVYSDSGVGDGSENGEYLMLSTGVFVRNDNLFEIVRTVRAGQTDLWTFRTINTLAGSYLTLEVNGVELTLPYSISSYGYPRFDSADASVEINNSEWTLYYDEQYEVDVAPIDGLFPPSDWSKGVVKNCVFHAGDGVDLYHNVTEPPAVPVPDDYDGETPVIPPYDGWFVAPAGGVVGLTVTAELIPV